MMRESADRRFLVGGLGGSVPALVNLYFFDFATPNAEVVPLHVLGNLFRALLAFILGGIWAWAHTDERKRVKLLELGIVAPAMLVTIISGSMANQHRAYAPQAVPPNTNSVSIRTTASMGVSTRASMMLVGVADSPPMQTRQVRRFSPPEQSGTEQFLQGLTGQNPTRIWFVIVSSHDTLARAESAARALKALGLTGMEFETELYEPSGGYPYYAVVIGANLERWKAVDLRQRALASGFPVTTDAWRLPI